MSNFTGNIEYFKMVEKINKYFSEIIIKEEEIITIKKEYGIEESDIEKNIEPPIVSLSEEEE